MKQTGGRTHLQVDKLMKSCIAALSVTKYLLYSKPSQLSATQKRQVLLQVDTMKTQIEDIMGTSKVVEGE